MAVGGAAGILGALRIIVDADSAKAERVLKSMGGKAQVAGAAIGAGIGTAAIGMLKLGDQYDAAMDSMRAATGATGEEFSRLEGISNTVAGRVTADLDEVTAATTALYQNTRQASDATVESLVDLSQLTSTGTAGIEAVTGLYANWNVAAEDQVAVNDMLLRAWQASGVGIDRLSESLAKNGVTLRDAGLDIEEATSLLAGLEQAGVDSNAIMGPLRKSIANLVKAGQDPREAVQGLFDAIKNAPDDVAAGQLALESFGAKGVGMASLIRDGTLDVDKLFTTIADGAETVQGASDETRDWADGFKELANQALSALGPITSSFAGLSDAMGNAIYLLPALGGLLGKSVVKVAQSSAVKGAASRAGSIIGRGIAFAVGPAMAMGSRIVDAITSSGAWEKAGKIAGGRFGTAFKLAAVVGIGLLLADQIAQLGEVRQANVEATKGIESGMDTFLAGMPTRAEAEAKLAALKAVPEGLDGIQEHIFNFGKFASGNPLGSAMDGIFGANPAQVLDDQVKDIEAYLQTVPADLQPTLKGTADALTEGVAKALEAADTGGAVAAATGTTLKEVRDGFAVDSKGLINSMVAELRSATPAFRAQVMDAMKLGPEARAALLTAIGPVREGVRSVFNAATAEAAKGIGNVRQALKDPPKMLSVGERIKRQRQNLQGVMKQLRRAVEVGDPLAIKYWDKARAKVATNLQRLQGTTTASWADIKAEYRRAGINIDGTWKRIKATTTEKANATENAAVDAAQDTKAGIDAVNLTASGQSMGNELAAGLRASIPNVAAAGNEVAAAAAGPLQAHSPPKTGPLSTIDQWGKPLIDAWLDPIAKQEEHARRVGARLAGAVAPHPRMGHVGAGGGAGGGRDTFNVGVLVADERGLDELDRRTGRRSRMTRRQHRDPTRY